MALLTGLLAFPLSTFPAASRRHQADARAAFDQAERLRDALESKPEKARRKSDYEKVIRAFREVCRLNPASSKAPEALAGMAKIYREMGRVYSSKRYYRNCARAYEFLIDQYPQSPAIRDALYALGDVYRNDLDNNEQARQAFAKYIEKYPRSAKAAGAREMLTEIDRAEEEHPAARPPASVVAAGRPMPEVIAEVVAIRRWVGPNYTRIVIGLEGEAKFDTSRLVNPDRIVLDLSNARLGAPLAAKTFPMEDSYLRQIRIAQYRPNVTRVVLDVQKIEDYSVFTLPNPFRLVVDIHGASVKAGEKAMSSIGSATPGSPPEVMRALNAPQVRPPALSRTGAALDADADPFAEARVPPANHPPSRAGGTAAGSGKANETDAHSVASAPPSVSDDATTGESKPFGPATEPGARTLTRALGLKIGRVVIDAGHGGHDTGTAGPTGLLEKDVVLDVALRLKKLLERNTQNQVVLTRRDDTFIPLEERTALANEKAADLFLSIHANASHDRSARGVETYYLNLTSNSEALEVAARENATSQESVHQLEDLIKKIALSEKVEESQEFARLVQRRMRETLAKAGSAQKDRGLKKAPFVVLIGANMPSILAEISFLTNPRDERLLRKAAYRQRIADALYAGISQYVDALGKPKPAEQARRTEPPPHSRIRDEATRARHSEF